MDAPVSRTLPDLLRERSRLDPDAVAVVCGPRSLTYEALSGRADALARGLHAAGMRPGDRVACLITNRAEWIELYFATGQVGATLVPLSTWSTRQELAFLLADSGARILFALGRIGERDLAADLTALADAYRPKGLTIVLVGDGAPEGLFTPYEAFLQAPGAAIGPPADQAVSAADDALILYTSGSTAKPKAVRLAHYGMIENGFNIGERQGLGPQDRVLVSVPLFWSYGGANALPATFTHGGAVVLLERFAAAEAIALIERHRCTGFYTLPSMTGAILKDPGFDRQRLASLRTGLTIGSPENFRDAAEGLGIPQLCNIYGATETYGNCCVTWGHWPLERRAHCQGPPLPGVEIRFLDPETGAPSPPGVPGLAEVRGYLSPGYTGESAWQNAEAFTADGFYRTQDIGYLNGQGDFVFVGRNSEMIKRAGINISPLEVEGVLLQHPSVSQCGVVGVPDPECGERIAAFVVPTPGAEIDVGELFRHVQTSASKYKSPDWIEVCAALPLTPTGKLLRNELKRTAAASSVRAG